MRTTVKTAIAIPLLLAVAGVVCAAFWASDLPPNIAEQWNSAGVSSTTTIVGIVLYIAASSVLVAGFSLIVALKSQSVSGTAAFMAIGGGLSIFITISLTGLMYDQRGNIQASDADGPPVGWIIAAAVIAILGAIAIATGLRRSSSAVSESKTAEHSAQGPNSGGVYVATIANWLLVMVLGVTGLSLLLAGGMIGSAILSVIGVFVLLSVFLAVWRVIVTPEQIHVFALIRLFSRKVPMREVRSIRQTTVRPFRDFGGYGLRSSVNGKAVGVIITSGDAIDIVTEAGKSTVITLPKAKEAVVAIEAIRREDAR